MSEDLVDLTQSFDEDCSSTDVDSGTDLPELTSTLLSKRYDSVNTENSVPGSWATSRASSVCSSELPELDLLGPGCNDQDTYTSSQSSQSIENSQSSCYSLISSSVNSSQNSSLGRKRVRDPDEAKRRKAEREEKKRQREEERMRKQEEKERLKLERANQRVIQKSQKPGECMKYISVIMEESIVQSAMGAKLMNLLQDSEVRYRFEKFAIEKLIVWQRETPADNTSQDSYEDLPEEADVVVMLSVDDFVQYIHSSANNNTEDINLALYIDQLKDNLPGKDISIVVQGMEKYFRDVKTMNQRQYRLNVQSASGNTDGPKKGSKKLKVNHVISRLELEECLVEMEVSTTVNFKFPETDEDTAKLVFSMTKAIAEAPFKKSKNSVDFSFLPENKNVVKVKQDGQGLRKLWTNQFLQFNNVSPDIANAITSEFPSPVLLMKAYSSAPSERDAELLLADIRVRRGAGVLETSRRIGKELSRRIYELMTSDDPNHLLQ